MLFRSTNEKYKGSAKLQKRFTVDFLQKKMKVNEGEVPQYYVENSHEAIIAPDEWEAVQAEMQRRKALGTKYSGNSVLATRLVCADCGSFFGSKVWHSTSKYRRVIWQCNHKFVGGEKCKTPHLDEADIKTRFMTAFNILWAEKAELIDNCRLIQKTLTDCTTLDAQIAELIEEIEVITELTKRCIAENSSSAQNQEEYTKKYNGYVERYEKAKAKVEKLQEQKEARILKADSIGVFMFRLYELDEPSTEFDDHLWMQTIDKVMVHDDGRLVFIFKNGTEIEG